MSNKPSVSANAPILVFDSGIGGLSVLRAIQDSIPNAPIVYAADYAGWPYGAKTEEEIAARVPTLLGRLVERYQPRLVTIACNTACTIALGHVRAALNLPIVGTVPAIKPAALATKTGVIGLLGTQATIRQPYVDQLEQEFASDKRLLRYAAPELVHAAEAKMRGETPDPTIFVRALKGLTEQLDGEQLDFVVLGCTHFPLVEDELKNAADQPMQFVDGAKGIARRIGVVTHGQSWPTPEKQIPGIFVTTGDINETRAYAPKLEKFGITNIASL
jgi:glutamate racemase